ncbi:hypothetical protein NLU13_8215 [Sarocladium strictum]|uniref:Major facilitator superfamily (MFS) profile domain-containing protein n=1 Tax=Sarocladium strictum TaxID=5046 RepID=A0AA39GBK5_SARSR|nr:hypothetical protein NLU13_8215 [Sarocladium strictum]
MGPQDDDGTPKLPKSQLTILAVVRFAEPLAFTSVNPYLPAMIRSFGVPQNKVAKWAGLTASVFSFAQSLTAVAWGKAADHYGRKPILISGLMCTMLCFIAWGMSSSLPMAISIRAIQGGSNGNVGIIRTMVAEMVPQKELQPRAFSIMPLVWSMGSVIGPSFGGSLSEPATQYPDIFGKIEFLKRFPFLLPNLVASIFFIVSTISAAFFLKETLPTKREEKDWGLLVGQRLTRALKGRPPRSPRRSSFVDGEATAPLLPSKPVRKHPVKVEAHSYLDVFTYQTVINLAAYTVFAFHAVAYDQNLPVFLSYPVVEHTPENTKLPFYFSGGFGLEPGQIGTIFTVYGITCCVVQFLAYPPLAKRFGVLRLLKLTSTLLPFAYFLTPYAVLFPGRTTRLMMLLFAMFLKAFCIIIAFPSITILLTNSCTSLQVLGTLNGFATMFSGLGRAGGPFLTGVVFDWGAEKGYILSAYWFLGAVAIVGAIPVLFIVEGEGPSPGEEEPSDSETETEDEVLANSGLVSVNGVTMEEEAVVDDEEDDKTAPLLGRHKNYGTTARS